MSGFCGWIGRGHVQDPASSLKIMADALPHHDIQVRESHHTVGASLALRGRAKSSFWAQTKNLIAVIEGNCHWTDPNVVEIAKARGHGEALAEAYRRYGPDLLNHLHGGFALAVFDESQNSGLLAIDRWGIHTLCYASTARGETVFGATTDAVRCFPGMRATILPQTLYTYFYLIDRIPAPTTIYQEQRKLVPGECIVIQNGHADVRTYWKMPYQEHGRTDTENLITELHEHLRSAIGRNIEGEGAARVGAFLSGGLDSSTVAGLLAEAIAPSRARTFTIGFDVEGFDETPFAEVAARHFSTDHTVYYTTPDDLLSILNDVATIYDEPFANSSAVPAYYCALQAKEAGVEVLLAGDGGDEFFGGNSRYLEDGIFDHYQSVPLPIRSYLIEPFLAHAPLRNRVPLLQRAANYVRYARMPVTRRVHRDNVYSKVDPPQIFSSEALAAIDSRSTDVLLENIFHSASSSSKLHKMFQFDLRVTLADSDLRKVNRMCELAGVHVRYPFLDDALGEFSASISPSILMQGGRLRAFYKHAMRDLLPDAIINKKKHGFGIPALEYVRGDPRLTDMFCDVIGGLKRWPWFSARFIDDVVGRVRCRDTRRYSGVAWDLALLALWLRSREPFDT